MIPASDAMINPNKVTRGPFSKSILHVHQSVCLPLTFRLPFLNSKNPTTQESYLESGRWMIIFRLWMMAEERLCSAPVGTCLRPRVYQCPHRLVHQSNIRVLFRRHFKRKEKAITGGVNALAKLGRYLYNTYRQTYSRNKICKEKYIHRN